MPESKAVNQNANLETITRLPDKLCICIFSYLKLKDLCRLALVCKRWKLLAYDSKLWTRVSLRADHNGLQVSNPEILPSVINNRFGSTLKYIELPAELVTPTVLNVLANKCPNLKWLTLDFSNAMQLHDFNDLNAFPCNLVSLTICLSEVIFMEGFMRKVYQSLSSLEVLHLIGTFELGDEVQEEVYEVINIGKIRSYTPNLKIVNFYGIGFVDDSHIDLLSSNCIHLECLALNYCLKVKGSSLKQLVTRCKKLHCLLLQHCALDDASMASVEWENSNIHELDMSCTELLEETLKKILTTNNASFTYLAVAHCEFFTDKILDLMIQRGKLERLRALDVSYTGYLSEQALYRLMSYRGKMLEGFLVYGKAKLTEQFFLTVLPCMKNIRILGCGTANGWFLKLSGRIYVDQIVLSISSHSTKLERLEMQWDPDTLKTSDNSSKFCDQLRIRCPSLKSITLTDGEYYETVKSNFERANRFAIVRATTNYNTSIVSLLQSYKHLLFN